MTIRSCFVLILSLALAAGVWAQGKKKKKADEEPVTQTLPVLKDPPGAVAAETARLVFHVSPLSSKGLLSQQVRDALKALMRDTHGASIVKLRAFVAGTGDMRRVQTIVSEVFTEKKLELPALSTIEAGGLPIEGAQVVIESVAVEKKVVNPNGLAFFSGQRAKDLRSAVAQLQGVVNSAGLSASHVLRATCFLSSLDGLAAGRAAVGAAFPAAAVNFVETQRLGVEELAECEAVGRLEKAPAQAVTFVKDAVLVNTQKLVLSGTQMAFRDSDADVKLAFERLRKAIEPLGATYRDVFWASTYPLTRPIAEKARAAESQFFDREHPPAGTMLLFEGLPSLDATMAVDVIAAGR